MYSLLRESFPAKQREATGPAGTRRAVSGTVVVLGLTSLLTDISSEMVTAVLPIYFIVELQLSPVLFGLVDGLYQGIGTPLRLVGGHIGDRLQRHKEVAATGYGVSGVCKLALPIIGSAWLLLLSVLVLDRLGKAIRTAPRDAMISLSTDERSLATAFGVHRAMDSIGAMLGPLLAFVILTQAPGSFDSIFVVSFCFALVGFMTLVTFADSPVRTRQQAVRTRTYLRAAISSVRSSGVGRILVAGTLLSVTTIGDAFIYLVLQRGAGFEFGMVPLLFIGTSVAYFALAVPAGIVADRVGRVPMILAGYSVLLIIYGSLLRVPTGPAEVSLYLLLLGAHYAATDGVLMALVSARVAPDMRGNGLAVVGSVTGIGRFGGAVLFGAAWAMWGPQTAVLVFLGGLVVALILATALLLPVRQERQTT